MIVVECVGLWDWRWVGVGGGCSMLEDMIRGGGG